MLIQKVFSNDDCERILKTTLGPHGVVDKRIRHFPPNGLYTVNSAYHLAMRVINDDWEYLDTPWKQLRKYKVPPKI